MLKTQGFLSLLRYLVVHTTRFPCHIALLMLILVLVKRYADEWKNSGPGRP